MVHPESKIRLVWDIVGFSFIFYQILFLPFRICFEEDAEGFLYGLELFIDVFFLLDIGMNFFMGNFKGGVIIMKRKVIAK